VRVFADGQDASPLHAHSGWLDIELSGLRVDSSFAVLLVAVAVKVDAETRHTCGLGASLYCEKKLAGDPAHVRISVCH